MHLKHGDLIIKISNLVFHNLPTACNSLPCAAKDKHFEQTTSDNKLLTEVYFKLFYSLFS